MSARRPLVLLALLLATSAALSAQLVPIEWNTEGIKTNPTAGTVLCQYLNVLPNAETRTVHFEAASSVSGILFMEQMAADNTTVIRAQALAVNAFVTLFGMKQVITLDIGERVRIRTSGTFSGSLQCSLFLDS